MNETKIATLEEKLTNVQTDVCEIKGSLEKLVEKFIDDGKQSVESRLQINGLQKSNDILFNKFREVKSEIEDLKSMIWKAAIFVALTSAGGAIAGYENILKIFTK